MRTLDRCAQVCVYCGSMLSTQFLSSVDVAVILRLSRSQVNRLAASGELPATKVGKSWVFESLDVEEYANNRRNPA